MPDEDPGKSTIPQPKLRKLASASVSSNNDSKTISSGDTQVKPKEQTKKVESSEQFLNLT